MSGRTNRRHFLVHVAAATTVLGSAASRSSLFAMTGPEHRITVGAHPWVYAAQQPQYDITPILDQIFADMKYAGMDAIELMHTALLPDDAVERIGALSRQHQLPVLGTSYGADLWDAAQHDKILADAQMIISRLAKLGGRTLGTSVGATAAKKTAAQLDAQAAALRKIMVICAEHGVTLNLHNHTYEVTDGMYDLRGTLERIPDAKLGPDLDWLVQAGVDPVQFIVEFGDRIVFLHLRDQMSDKKWVESLGEGQMNYDAIRIALEKVHFSGDAVIELAHPSDLKLSRPLRESLKMSRQFVRDKLGY